MEFYLLNYSKPTVYRQTAETRYGNRVSGEIGCTDCYAQTLRIEHDRRVADVGTRFDPSRGVFNNLFATASLRLSEIADVVRVRGARPRLVRPVELDQPLALDRRQVEAQHCLIEERRHRLQRLLAQLIRDPAHRAVRVLAFG
jgi:hypothetical protein